MRILFPRLASNSLFLFAFRVSRRWGECWPFFGWLSLVTVLSLFAKFFYIFRHLNLLSSAVSAQASTRVHFPFRFVAKKKKNTCENFQNALSSHSTSISFSHFNPSLLHTATHVCSTFHTQFNVGTGEWIFILQISVRFFLSLSLRDIWMDAIYS